MASARQWVLGLAPLAVLAALVALFVAVDPTETLRVGFPPLEELTIERVTMPEPGMIKVRVVNGGPEPVTVAQVMVDEAYWAHELDGDRTIPRLGSRVIDVPYPWVEGEPHEIVLITSTGVTFAHEVAVATLSPRPNAQYFKTFTLLGLYVGFIPVLIGLLWFPFVREISRKWVHFFLSLTIGLLIFLGVEALDEAIETARMVPEAFQGIGLVVLGALGSVVILRGLDSARGAKKEAGEGDGAANRLRLAYLIALGIGLHNLGEGLAIGSAYALGEIALGSFLVIGFAIHNTTEGLAIVAPAAADRPPLWHFLAMGALAGLPTIAGAWIGGFSYSPAAATLFLALGAGAILQVVLAIGGMLAREARDAGLGDTGLLTPLNSAGIVAGLLIMYGTALLVAA